MIEQEKFKKYEQKDLKFDKQIQVKTKQAPR